MNRRGFSYVEMLVAVGVLFSITGGMAFVLSEAGRKTWARTEAQVTGQSRVQGAMNRLASELRTASRTHLSCSISPEAKLTFTDADGKTVTYIHDGNKGQLIRTQDKLSRIVMDHLSAFTPTCSTNGIVGIELTIETPTSQGIVFKETVESQVWIRTPAS